MTTFDMSRISNDLHGHFTPEHVFLVGLQVRGETREEAETTLTHFLPRPNGLPNPSPIECWWIAEDDRNDRSDNDSAVFVEPGAQPLASTLLHSLRLTGSFNKVQREGGQFTGHYEPQDPGTRYERARAVHDLMATLQIGQGDLDLIDVLDRAIDDGQVDESKEAEAFTALAGKKEYEWHGMQEDLWERLREHTYDNLRDKDFLIDDEDE